MICIEDQQTEEKSKPKPGLVHIMNDVESFNSLINQYITHPI